MEFRRLLFGLCLVAFLLYCFLSLYTSELIHSTYYAFVKRNVIQPAKDNFNKWIVITTVSEISEDLKNLAELSEWKILIVADRNTLQSLHCQNCVYLSVEEQLNLNYKVIPLLSGNSYARKIVGYLYAIENGAKFIYDTVPTIRPIKSKLDSFDYTNTTTSLVVDSETFNITVSLLNPYCHFGRPDVWPRGFPSQLIDDAYSKEYDFQLCDPITTPIIQQGLVNGDDDVITGARNKIRKFDNVIFDPIAPPFMLPRNIYGPLNGQNTLFHYRAFWALLLPISVSATGPLTDIWRGYWAQRLMHLTGDNLGYYGVNAKEREFFQYLSENNQIYDKSLDLVESLRSWNCQSNTFPNCTIELTGFMADRGFVSESNIELSEKWIEDLTKIGYEFPAIDTGIKELSCRNASFVSTMRHVTNPVEIRTNSLKTLDNFCDTFPTNRSNSTYVNSDFKLSNVSIADLSSSYHVTNSFNHTKNVILVITFNLPFINSNVSFIENIPLLQILYEPWFANVVFCGIYQKNFKNFTLNRQPPFDRITSNKKKYSYVAVTYEEINGGYLHYSCLHYVADMKIRDVEGYFLIADDALLNFWSPFDLNRVHFKNECVYDPDYGQSGWMHWAMAHGLEAMLNLQSELNDTIRNNKTVEWLDLSPDVANVLYDIVMITIRCGSDIFYVPQKAFATYTALSKLFRRNFVFLEIAVGKILAILGWMKEYKMVVDGLSINITDMPGQYYWGFGRHRPFHFFWNPEAFFIHPVKFQQFRDPLLRQDFCDKYVAHIFEVARKGASSPRRLIDKFPKQKISFSRIVTKAYDEDVVDDFASSNLISNRSQSN